MSKYSHKKRKRIYFLHIDIGMEETLKVNEFILKGKA